MLPYEFYKIVHIFGLGVLFLALGAAALRLALVNFNTQPTTSPSKKFIGLSHGVALLLLLVGGFGMLARMELHGNWDGWIWVKLAAWVIFGGMIALIKRQKISAKALCAVSLGLLMLVLWVVTYKPF